MRKIILLVMFMLSLVTACKKETSRTGDVRGEDIVELTMEIDGEKLDLDYDGDKVNECTPYSFGGYSGNYFGVTSAFELGRNLHLEITFGTIKSGNTVLSEEEFLTLVAPGKREYGSLGSFTSNPGITPGKVEIAYTDKKSIRWCSSYIKEIQTPYGLETKVEVKQDKSDFTITELKKVASGYRIKGRFDCVLYEVNAKHKKKLKGSFAGVVRL